MTFPFQMMKDAELKASLAFPIPLLVAYSEQKLDLKTLQEVKTCIETNVVIKQLFKTVDFLVKNDSITDSRTIEEYIKPSRTFKIKHSF